MPIAKNDPQNLLEGETLKRAKLDFYAMTGPILTQAPIQKEVDRDFKNLAHSVQEIKRVGVKDKCPSCDNYLKMLVELIEEEDIDKIKSFVDEDLHKPDCNHSTTPGRAQQQESCSTMKIDS